jgi:asparagine synthase (glutamine-hydrolysing)
MCGIAGICSSDPSESVSPEVLGAMIDTLQHRGPDDRGLYLNGPVGLAARRLSIIDLSTGHQPIGNEKGDIWIAYNGEVYNFEALREQLAKFGHTFVSHSDTEVIVHAYEQWGIECLSRLNGMFAFALWDGRDSCLWLVRDRLGVKPLYYRWKGGRLTFGSEIKAILKDPVAAADRGLDLEGLDAYLRYVYVPSPLTLFDGIRKLPPGHWLKLKGGEVVVRSYWQPPLSSEGEVPDEAEASEKVLGLLEDSVHLRLVSDVPLGAFLSGGIDSSSIVGLMSRSSGKPVQTFSVGFEGEDGSGLNELEGARRVARLFETEHHEMVVSDRDFMEAIPWIAHRLDDPVADHAIVPTHLISRLARKSVKVALSGEGADELFAGYESYGRELVLNRMDVVPSPLRQVASKLPVLSARHRRIISRSTVPLRERYSHTKSSFFENPDTVYDPSFSERLGREKRNPESFFSPWMGDSIKDPVNAMLRADLATWLPENLLMKVDKASMLTSLEARVPFLDYRLVEYVSHLPGNFKLRGRQTKYLLKKAVAGLLPGEVVHRRKHGFVPPTGDWLRLGLKDWAWERLANLASRKGLLNREWVESLWSRHQSRTRNYSQILFALILLEEW